MKGYHHTDFSGIYVIYMMFSTVDTIKTEKNTIKPQERRIKLLQDDLNDTNRLLELTKYKSELMRRLNELLEIQNTELTSKLKAHVKRLNEYREGYRACQAYTIELRTELRLLQSSCKCKPKTQLSSSAIASSSTVASASATHKDTTL